jgi:hypothetical protein
MFISEGPPFVMSRTDAQNGLDMVFNGFRNILALPIDKIKHITK